MARVLILEPSPDVRDLLRHHVTRVGHEAVVARDGEPLPRADVALVEPGDAQLVAALRAATAERGRIPVVCVSVYPRDGATADLDPVAFVLKPFTLSNIRAALQQALSEFVTSQASEEAVAAVATGTSSRTYGADLTSRP